jgi:serine protease Do
MGEEFAGSVTSGIISALNRSISMNDGGYTRRYQLIQTDAAINPGNSGGALINQDGEVIGINSIKFATDNVEGMGFAIPINDVKTIIDELMSHGYVSHPYLGVSVETITNDMAQQNNCPVGVGVDSVVAGSAAEAAGIHPGDIILELDGTKLTTNNDLVNNVAKHKVGDSIKLKVWRNGSTITISVTVGENKGTTN